MTSVDQQTLAAAPAPALLQRKSLPTAGDENVVDPQQEARLVARDWSGGVEAIINVGLRICRYLQRFARQPAQIDTFIMELEKMGVLTRNEARQGVHSPKLVKLRVIGEHAELLRHPDIGRYLGPSYPVMYQLVVLFKEIEGDDNQKMRHLLEALAGAVDHDDDKFRAAVTREYLSNQTAAVKSKKKSKKSPEQARPTSVAGREGTSLSKLVESGAQRDLIAMDVTGRGKVFGDDYAPGCGLADCLPIFKVAGDRSSIVVLGKLSDFPAIETKLLPACGFQHKPEVLLLRKPAAPLVTEAEILITAQRGGVVPELSAIHDWLVERQPIDLNDLAQRLYPAATTRLRAFAEAAAEGWTCLLGDGNTWVKEPTLR